MACHFASPFLSRLYIMSVEVGLEFSESPTSEPVARAFRPFAGARRFRRARSSSAIGEVSGGCFHASFEHGSVLEHGMHCEGDSAGDSNCGA